MAGEKQLKLLEGGGSELSMELLICLQLMDLLEVFEGISKRISLLV